MVKSGYDTAVHEAGHAVVGLVTGMDVIELSIIPDDERNTTGGTVIEGGDQLVRDVVAGDSWGFTPEEYAAAYGWLDGRVLTTLAGATAEQRVTGEWNSEGAHSDVLFISDMVQVAYGHPDPDAPVEPDPLLVAPVLEDYYDEELGREFKFVDDYEPVVERARERWGDECRDILEQNWAWVEAVAQAAMDGDGTVTGDQMKALRPEDD